jgi:hypothetical protein
MAQHLFTLAQDISWTSSTCFGADCSAQLAPLFELKSIMPTDPPLWDEE